MKTSFKNTVNLENGLLKANFFTINESHLVLNFKEEKKVFNLDEISNLRFIKIRNYSINILFLTLALLIYYFTLFFFKTNLLLSILSQTLGSVFIIISLSIKIYNHSLLINIGHFGFKMLKVSKKDSLSAENLAWIFKTNYLEKNNQNQLEFLNWKHSS
jgi:hypothetical protein